MIERSYTYTISHCSNAVEYGLIWVLEKHNLEKGCILVVGKGNFCRETTEVYKEGLGESFVNKLYETGFVDLNGRRIELQYPRNMSLSSVGSVLAIYPPRNILNKIEEEIAHNYRLDRPYLPTIKNALPKSLLIIPWVEFDVETWIKQYNPNRIDIDCADYYKYGKNSE